MIAEQQVQTILNSVDALVIVVQRVTLISANQAAMDWLGSETYVGQKVWKWIAPESRRDALIAYSQVQKGQSESLKNIYTVKIGNRPRQNIEASIKAAAFLGQDYWLITFRPLANKANNQQSFQSTAPIVKNPILGELIFENRIVNNTLNKFLETLQTIIPYESASIALINQGKLEFIAARGLGHIEALTDLNHSHEALNPKITGLAKGQAQIIHDVYEYPHWVKIEGTENIRSWMGIPLHFEDAFIGILNLDHSQPNFFNPVLARYAIAMAEQATMAIVYTRLYQEAKEDIAERQRLQQVLIKNLINTETLYAAQQILFESDSLTVCLDDVLNIISAALDNSQLLILIFDTKSGQLIHRAENLEKPQELWSIFTEVIGLEQLSFETMPPHDLEWNEGEIRYLKDGRKLMAGIVNQRGLLLAVRHAEEENFSESEHELIVTLANQISIALENELLYAALRQHSEDLERLVEERTNELAFEQRRLQAILDATAEGIFYMENFLIQYANPAFCRMVGYTLEELRGKPLSFLRVLPEVPEQHNFNALLDKPLDIELGRSETRLRTRDGREFHASIRFSLIGQPGENPVRMVAIGRDVSQERKLYFQRARFIANAAHELRTPLSSLVLRLHMLRRQPERMNDHIDSLDKVTNYLRQLVEQLLDLSRFERGSIQLERDTFIMQDLLEQALQEHRPFAEEEGISLNVVMPNEEITAKVDGTRMVQAMSNLIVNAINYNKRGGEGQISMHLDEDSLGNRNVIIEVTDNGIGIEPELLPDDIFEPFSRPSQGSRKETGMGLALVREIIHLHGGAIYAMSRVDEGSSFHIKLPLEN